MAGLKLYLFIGYPCAGKTSVSKLIEEATGAVHIWADNERHKLFENPTHSAEESNKLYAQLNARTDELLGQGKSVIFDTNFNFRRDRDYLREIAAKHGAETVLIWLQTPVDIARQRAVHDSNLRNGYKVKMTEEHFDKITSKLEPPTADEQPIIINTTEFNPELIRQRLHL